MVRKNIFPASLPTTRLPLRLIPSLRKNAVLMNSRFFSVRLIGIMAFLLLLLNSFLVGQRCSCFDDFSFSWCEFFLFWSLASYLDHGMCYPEGCAAPGSVPCQCNTRGLLSKLEETPPQTKINVTSKSPVGDISVVTLIRTDTTLDHSQKAEKV